MKKSGWDYIQVASMNEVSDILDKQETWWRKHAGVENLVIKTHGGQGDMIVATPNLHAQEPTNTLVSKGFGSLRAILKNNATVVHTACNFVQDNHSDNGFTDYWAGGTNRSVYFNATTSHSMGGEKNNMMFNFHSGLAHHYRGSVLSDWDYRGFIKYGANGRLTPDGNFIQITVNQNGGLQIDTKPKPTK